MLNKKQMLEIGTTTRKLRAYEAEDTDSLESDLIELGERIIAAQTVSFPEPTEEDKNTFSYKISGTLLRKINEASYLSDETDDEIPMHIIEFVLLVYQKLMNEGKV